MKKAFILINTLLIPFFHFGVVFAMVMSMSQATTNQEIVDNLYWVIPVNVVFASIPNILIALYYVVKKQTSGLAKSFLTAEVYAVIIQAVLHLLVILYFFAVRDM